MVQTHFHTSLLLGPTIELNFKFAIYKSGCKFCMKVKYRLYPHLNIGLMFEKHILESLEMVSFHRCGSCFSKKHKKIVVVKI